MPRPVSYTHLQAIYWYRKAAEQGNSDGLVGLGLIYDGGKGVPQDYTQAIYWYRKAAEQGNFLAQFFLGMMYFQGKGVVEDNVTSLMWFYISAREEESLGRKKKFGQKPMASMMLDSISKDVYKRQTYIHLNNFKEFENGTTNLWFVVGRCTGYQCFCWHHAIFAKSRSSG